MNLFSQVLDDRAAAQRDRARDAAKVAEVWQLRGERPEVRLLAFDRWLRIQLETRLDWAWAGGQRERRIEQCRMVLEQLVLELWRRGWMLDGRTLAARIVSVLNAVGARQKKSPIDDFWAYFRSSVNRYVGANAEEIQHEARKLGAHVGGVVAALGLGAREGATLPELAAQRAAEVAQAKEETLREKLARERVRNADAGQQQLF